jgi:pyrimidine-nucleoside phosphorylase
MDEAIEPALHMIDLIRLKRDGGTLDARELNFLVAGAADESIPAEQLAAWLMAAWLRGLSLEETRALALAMRDSGEKFDPRKVGKVAVDKHSTGGVGDKTSFLVAPLAAACGLAVPMISGRALGHTGGTLDKLEAIPGYRTALTLKEFEEVLARCGASIVSQTPSLVPADRVLYALRDRTGTVENPGLICASILSKKLAAGLNALVLDVKTGSGAFLRKREDADYLAALMVATAEAAGTRTAALMTDMGQPLGRTAGNWIEIAERGRAHTVLATGGVDDSSGRKIGDAGGGLWNGRGRAARWLGAEHFFQNGGSAGGRCFGLRRSVGVSQAGSDRSADSVGEWLRSRDGHDGAGMGGATVGRGARESRRGCRPSCGD